MRFSRKAGVAERLVEIVRAGEWWEFKLVPIFAMFYATALVLGESVLSLWTAAVMTLLALVPGAAYVSVINDLTDRSDDAVAGKWNRVAGRPQLLIALSLSLPIACGLAFAYVWRDDRLLSSFYLAAWLAFSLYSLPPFRLKKRGLFGVVCDASGAHLFPTLVAVVLVYRASQAVPSMRHLLIVGAWAFAYGLRGILGHQLADLENDRRAGVRTFAARHPRSAMLAGTWLAFSVELAALGALLASLGSGWPPAFLLMYAVYTFLRLRWWRMKAVIVAPKDRSIILLEDYYRVFLPIAVLVAMHEWIVLAMHLALFPVGPLRTVAEASKLAHATWNRARQRLQPR